MPDKINIEKNAQCLSEIEGEFMSYINFDKRCYWRFGEKEFPQMKRDTFTLPSDSCYRDDLIWFRENDLELSQRFKVFMEEKQKINCTVESCQYNNLENHKCTLKEIMVTPIIGCETKEPDESMCSSYKNFNK